VQIIRVGGMLGKKENSLPSLSSRRVTSDGMKNRKSHALPVKRLGSGNHSKPETKKGRRPQKALQANTPKKRHARKKRRAFVSDGNNSTNHM